MSKWFTNEEILALVMADTLPQSFHDTVEARYYRKNHPEKNPPPPVTPREPEVSPQLELAL
jgi:hypothetical protein